MAEEDPGPERIIIFDTTLRGGEQTAGVNFNLDDKVAIAQRLSALGVDVIEAGFPAAVPGDAEAARTIANTVDDQVICALARATEADIESAWAAIEPAKDKTGARIHTFISTSQIHMEKMLGMTPEHVVEATRAAVTKAREFTEDVEFSVEDATRSKLRFMTRVILEAVDAGATTISIPDTVGITQPRDYAKIFRYARRAIEHQFGANAVVLSAQGHDDLGFATANTMAAVDQGGARQVEVTVGGLGSRAGIAPLEQVAAVIRNKYSKKFYTKIDTPLLTSVTRDVLWRAGIQQQPNSPITGANAFVHSAGIHQDGVLKDEETYEHLAADEYGQESARIVASKLAGKAGVKSRISGMGIKVKPAQLAVITNQVKEMSKSEGRAIVDSDIEGIVGREVGMPINQRYTVEAFELERRGTMSMAMVRVADGWTSAIHVQTAESSKGGLDAAVMAANQAIGFDGEIVRWTNDPRRAGPDSPAGIFCTAKQGGHQVETYAQATSVDEASIRAYIKAINLIKRVELRNKRPKQPNPNRVVARRRHPAI